MSGQMISVGLNDSVGSNASYDNVQVRSNEVRCVQLKPVRRVGSNGSNDRPMSQFNTQPVDKRFNVMNEGASVVKDVILCFELGINVSKEE